MWGAVGSLPCWPGGPPFDPRAEERSAESSEVEVKSWAPAGELHWWGDGFFGGVADTPEHVEARFDGPIVSVAVGGQCAVLLTARGTVWGYGDSTYGELGSAHPRLESPQPLRTADGPVETAVAISAGESHVLCVLASGEVWASGCNAAGQCGAPVSSYCVRGLSRVDWDEQKGDPPERAVAVSAGQRHSAIVTHDGGLYVWGHAGGKKLVFLRDDVKVPEQGESLRSGVKEAFRRPRRVYSLLGRPVLNAALGDDCTFVVVGSSDSPGMRASLCGSGALLSVDAPDTGAERADEPHEQDDLEAV